MSMSRDQLLRYFDNPATLNERTLGELKEILDEYPYFQSAHLLYARNLQNENNFRFASQLKLTSLYATDRSRLYWLLNNRLEKQNIDPMVVEVMTGKREDLSAETAGDCPFDVDHEGSKDSDLLNFELNVNSSYQLESEFNESEKSLSELAQELKHPPFELAKDAVASDDLIGRFIKENPVFMARGKESSEISEKINRQSDHELDSDEFITETLARIYMKQGLYQKSISAFERLSLKYPEKSAYFARQIEEVTNLLNK